MDLLEKIILNSTFVMIYIIRKMLALLKNRMTYLKDNIFDCFFKKYNKLSFLKKIIIFSKYIMMRNLRSE